MVEAIPVDLKVTLKYAKGSFTYGDLKMTAENEDVFELAGAINAIQSKPMERVIKTEVFALSSY